MLKEIGLAKEAKDNCFQSGSIYSFTFIGWVILVILLQYEQYDFTKYLVYLFVAVLNIIILLLNAIANFYNKHYEKIILSEKGISYKAFGIRIYTEWNRLNHVEEDRGLLHSKNKDHNFEYIPVRKDDVSRKFYAWIVNYRNILPLSRFGKNWRDSILGEILKEKVPHIFNM